MNTYALDTNIISYFLKDEENVVNNMSQALMEGHKFIIPQVVDYETCRGFMLSDKSHLFGQYRMFAQKTPIGKICDDVWVRAMHVYVELRKKGMPADDADILIAAFCLVNGYILATENLKHFRHIEGLKAVNWKE